MEPEINNKILVAKGTNETEIKQKKIKSRKKKPTKRTHFQGEPY